MDEQKTDEPRDTRKLIISNMQEPEDAIKAIREFIALTDGDKRRGEGFDGFVAAHRDISDEDLIEVVFAAESLLAYSTGFKQGVTMLLGERGYRLKAALVDQPDADARVARALTDGFEIEDRSS